MVAGNPRAALRRRDLTGFGIGNLIFLLLLCFTMLYPFWNTRVRSLSANSAILSGRVYLWPVGLNVEGYQTLFRDGLFFVSLRNTLFTTIVGTGLRLAVTLLAGYAFSKKNLVDRKTLFLVFLLTMFFEGGIVPTFIIVRNLGLYNTLWALVLIEAAKVFYMILAMSFFRQIPEAVEESALIDGAGYEVVFLRIVVPMSKALIATLIIFSTVDLWNQFREAVIYIRESKHYTLQVYVRIKVFLEEMIQRDPSPSYVRGRVRVGDAEGHHPGGDQHPHRAGVPLLPALLHQGRHPRRGGIVTRAVIRVADDGYRPRATSITGWCTCQCRHPRLFARPSTAVHRGLLCRGAECGTLSRT